MTTSSDGNSKFAELLDDLLEQIQNGQDPDLAAVAARHPEVAHRASEALSLAGSLAGRKVSTRPALPGYEIVRELGRGGMGTVYLARQDMLQRQVALKVLPHSFGLSAASRQRFLEEARALAQVKHEHIVDIHRIVDDGEMLAFEMEFVDGPSLHAVLASIRGHVEKTGSQPSLAEVGAAIGIPVAALGARNLTQFFVRLGLKIARALAAVHKAGFVHRDVKPANVLLRQNGDPVVVDFGLVRLHGLEVTQAGRYAGTPVYSSPEQLRGEVAVGPSSDVYSLGVTLYECLTLATPFAGRTTTDLLQRIEQGRFEPLRRLAPNAPRDLETIVVHAMEVDPLQRYANAGELADDLQRLLELHPIQARPVSAVRRAGKFLRRHRRPLVAACVGAVVVAAALFPVLNQVEAKSRARVAAAEHVHRARQHVIRVDSGSVAWRQAIHGNAARPRLQAEGELSMPLRDALKDYELALSAVPDDTTVRREHDVVRLAVWLQQLTVQQTDTIDRALAGDAFATLTRSLGPVTVRAARRIAGESGAEPVDEQIATASDDDRAGLGLLAYLCGDFRLCEQAWSNAPAELDAEPLVDAGLGRMLLADGMLEPAYARLLQAQRSFPDCATLTTELADAAMRLGDLRLARQWVARLPTDDDATASPRRRLQLDLRAASEAGVDLVDDYRQLVDDDPYDPVARHRLAQLAMRRGDLRTAEAELETLLRDWPAAAEFRLDRARVALQRRDLFGYSRQVLAVLDLDFGRGRSRGTTADLLEILRIGGLEDLYLEGVAATGRETAGRAMFGGEFAIHSFAPEALTRHFTALARFGAKLHSQVETLQAGQSHLDDYAATLLRALPLSILQLPVAGLLDLPERLLVAMVPRAGAIGYPLCLPYVRQWFLDLHLSDWRSLRLDRLELPVATPETTAIGNAMLRVDDRSGDGFDDLLVACPTQHPSDGPGHVFLVDGMNDHVLATLTNESDQHVFGHAIAVVDDLDGDGAKDWIIGCPAGSKGVRSGRVEIWSGARQRRLRILNGDGPSFGASVAGLGDCDGDGVPEFAIAIPPLLRNSAAQGSVQVLSGRTFEVLHTLRNDVPGVWFAGCIASVGDTDGDRVPDLVVGGNYGGAPGLVRLYSGKTGAVLHTWTDASSTSGFGRVVRAAGDIDEDGSADVVITAVDLDKVRVDQVFVYSGSTGRELCVLSGRTPGDGFGTQVVPFAGTGSSTVLAIGLPRGSDPGSGAVELWSLRGDRLATLLGPRPYGAFGWAIAVLEDRDGDGLPELLVAAPGPIGTGAGAIWRAASDPWLRNLRRR